MTGVTPYTGQDAYGENGTVARRGDGDRFAVVVGGEHLMGYGRLCRLWHRLRDRPGVGVARPERHHPLSPEVMSAARLNGRVTEGNGHVLQRGSG